jgi:hypothetical protein
VSDSPKVSLTRLYYCTWLSLTHPESAWLSCTTTPDSAPKCYNILYCLLWSGPRWTVLESLVVIPGPFHKDTGLRTQIHLPYMDLLVTLVVAFKPCRVLSRLYLRHNTLCLLSWLALGTCSCRFIEHACLSISYSRIVYKKDSLQQRLTIHIVMTTSYMFIVLPLQ